MKSLLTLSPMRERRLGWEHIIDCSILASNLFTAGTNSTCNQPQIKYRLTPHIMRVLPHHIHCKPLHSMYPVLPPKPHHSTIHNAREQTLFVPTRRDIKHVCIIIILSKRLYKYPPLVISLLNSPDIVFTNNHPAVQTPQRQNQHRDLIRTTTAAALGTDTTTTFPSVSRRILP